MIKALCFIHLVILADFASPGTSRVPQDYVIEIDREYPNFRFFLVSARGVETLPLSSAQPFLIDGAGRHGSHRIARIAAVSTQLIEQDGQDEINKMLSTDIKRDGILYTESFDFAGHVFFYDSRDRVVDRYQLSVTPNNQLKLTWLEQNKAFWLAKVAWIVAGISAMALMVWCGMWILRKLTRIRLT